MLIQTIIDYLLVMFAEQRYVYRTEDDFKVEPEIGRRQVHFSIGSPQTGRSNLLLSGIRASVYTSMSHPGCDVFFSHWPRGLWPYKSIEIPTGSVKFSTCFKNAMRKLSISTLTCKSILHVMFPSAPTETQGNCVLFLLKH